MHRLAFGSPRQDPHFYQGSDDPNVSALRSALQIFSTIKNDRELHQLPVFQFLGLDLVRRDHLPGCSVLPPEILAN